MPITLDEIEDLAKQESADWQHYYLGVEHIFITLTKIEGGLTARLLARFGQTAVAAQLATRDAMVRGDGVRDWHGFRQTPRARSVLARAYGLVHRMEVEPERALLDAILEEGDSLPVRAMRSLGLEPARLREALPDLGDVDTHHSRPATVRLESEEELDEPKQIILTQMFQNYGKLKIERVFRGGFSGASVMLVQPYQLDGRAYARVVVKFADPQDIQWEKRRYDQFVHSSLQYRIARIDAEPVIRDDQPLAGLKYMFVHEGDSEPLNLSGYAAGQTPVDVARFIYNRLYLGFREGWWGQASPYQFHAWREYELLLPPALVVEALSRNAETGSVRRLQPMDPWSHNRILHAGETVLLDGFTVHKVKTSPDYDGPTLHICAGAEPDAINQSSRIEVRGLDMERKRFMRGEPMRSIAARIVETRDDLLRRRARALGFTFNIDAERLPYGGLPIAPGDGAQNWLPNPLLEYTDLLNRRVFGMLSTIHGDLHCGNILIGPGGDAWLIDFEWTRDGHTLFDWATLELSLLIDYVLTQTEPTEEALWEIVRLVDWLNRHGPKPPPGDTRLAQAMLPIVAIRRIVEEIVQVITPRMETRYTSDVPKALWSGYYLALALTALRGASWAQRSTEGRQLQFLLAALATEAANRTNTAPERTTT